MCSATASSQITTAEPQTAEVTYLVSVTVIAVPPNGLDGDWMLCWGHLHNVPFPVLLVSLWLACDRLIHMHHNAAKAGTPAWQTT